MNFEMFAGDVEVVGSGFQIIAGAFEVGQIASSSRGNRKKTNCNYLLEKRCIPWNLHGDSNNKHTRRVDFQNWEDGKHEIRRIKYHHQPRNSRRLHRQTP